MLHFPHVIKPHELSLSLWLFKKNAVQYPCRPKRDVTLERTETCIYLRPSLWTTYSYMYMYTTAEPFPHLALFGQCIVDCQQCTVGSSPVVGLRRLHESVESDVGWCWESCTKHVAAVEDLHAATQLLCFEAEATMWGMLSVQSPLMIQSKGLLSECW